MKTKLFAILAASAASLFAGETPDYDALATEAVLGGEALYLNDDELAQFRGEIEETALRMEFGPAMEFLERLDAPSYMTSMRADIAEGRRTKREVLAAIAEYLKRITIN